MPMNLGLTFFALSPQNYVRENRHIEPKRNTITTGGTSGGREDYRLPPWKPINEYIEKASKGCPQDSQ